MEEFIIFIMKVFALWFCKEKAGLKFQRSKTTGLSGMRSTSSKIHPCLTSPQPQNPPLKP